MVNEYEIIQGGFLFWDKMGVHSKLNKDGSYMYIRQMQYDNFELIQSKIGKEFFNNQDFLYLFLRNLTKILALYDRHHVGCFLADLKKTLMLLGSTAHTLYLYFVKLHYLTPFRMQNHP